MPIVNFTVPDSAPWINYLPVGAWGDSDTATQDYFNGTFHFTSVTDAFATFTFNGTAVQLFGAFRGNHDLYTVTLDGGNTTADGLGGNDPDDFNRTLFSSPSLSLGQHTVTLSNTPKTSGMFVDLDWAVIQVGDGKTDTISNDFWLDDTTANFTYDSSWSVGSGGSFIPQYYNQSFHSANANGAKATFSFFGNAVSLYGASSTNHGPYSVSLDGMPAQNFNGSQVAFRPQQLLYYASSLPLTQHTLVLTNTADNTFTDIDFAIVSRWDSSTPLPGALAPVNGAGSSSSSAGASGTGGGITTLPITNAGGPTAGSSPTPSSSPDKSGAVSMHKGSVMAFATVFALALFPALVML